MVFPPLLSEIGQNPEKSNSSDLMGDDVFISKQMLILVFQQNKDNNTDPSLVTPIVKQRILYARVSSTHQSEDLQRQITFLQSQYPNDTLIQDIGSGLNWKRKGLGQLLNQAL